MWSVRRCDRQAAGSTALAARLGQTGRERVRALFLNDWHFVRWAEVFGSALEGRAGHQV